MTQEIGHTCPECMEDVDICDGCGEIIHYDDPKALTGRATYCHWCYKKDFRGICANRKIEIQETI